MQEPISHQARGIRSSSPIAARSVISISAFIPARRAGGVSGGAAAGTGLALGGVGARRESPADGAAGAASAQSGAGGAAGRPSLQSAADGAAGRPSPPSIAGNATR